MTLTATADIVRKITPVRSFRERCSLFMYNFMRIVREIEMHDASEYNVEKIFQFFSQKPLTLYIYIMDVSKFLEK